MNVAVVTSLYPSPPRPFEGIFAERRWLRMAAKGHRVHVVHPQPMVPPGVARWLPLPWQQIAAMPQREERDGIQIVRPRYLHMPGRALGNARRFVRCALPHLRAEDAVVCDYAWPASNLAPVLRSRGIPCVISGRGSDVLQVAEEDALRDALSQNLKAAGHWCAVSDDLVQAMDHLAGKASGKLVPNGVDLDLFRVVDRDLAREKLELARDLKMVLVVGHLIPRKDPCLALDAFLSGTDEEAHLYFIGRGPMEDELREAIAARGASSRVTLLGEKMPGEIATWLAASDLLLLTSHREGRPNVVLEALAAGRPVLATAAGGTAEVLPEPRMLAESRKPTDIGRQLAALLGSPPEPAELRASVEPLSWENSTRALEECLEAAISGSGVAA